MMNFEIREIHECGTPDIHIDIEGIRMLPYALKRLAELGYDMERSLEALREAVDDQRKRKVLDAAINAIAADQVKKQ